MLVYPTTACDSMPPHTFSGVVDHVVVLPFDNLDQGKRTRSRIEKFFVVHAGVRHVRVFVELQGRDNCLTDWSSDECVLFEQQAFCARIYGLEEEEQ